MGAEPYSYLVDYEEDVQSALNKLRRKVFESGEFATADLNPGTPEEALEMADEDGTASILDIMTVSDEPELCTASPFSKQELEEVYGTDQPTVAMLEDNFDDLWEEIERGMARYVIAYEEAKPSKIFFAGYSFD
jgi:hypothetical protein